MKKVLLELPDEVNVIRISCFNGDDYVTCDTGLEIEDFTTIKVADDEFIVESGLKVDVNDCVDILRVECSNHQRCADCNFHFEGECCLRENIPELW